MSTKVKVTEVEKASQPDKYILNPDSKKYVLRNSTQGKQIAAAVASGSTDGAFTHSRQIKMIIEKLQTHCKLTDGVGIVYCQTRRSVKEMVKLLMSNRISCGVYHGGLTKSERERMLNDWMTEKRRIMVATNAFGMGIDKPNVRFVLHYEIPSSLEAYFQEAGRGGRDGETSKALLFFEEKDTLQLKESTLKKFPKKEDVLNTYRAISNYLKIAIGSGKDETYPLDLKKICQVFKLDYETTFHSLRILELNENLLFSEGTYHPTKLRFLVDNRELYNFQIQYESAHALSTLLTRSYPGIFDYFHAIHEAL